MNKKLFQKLHSDGFITPAELEMVLDHPQKPVSIYWDLKTLLYLGILLLTSGLGIIIYKNIDRIGHLAIVIFIAVCTLACFAYCFKNAAGYKKSKVQSPSLLFDYTLLAGCLLLVILIGYLQFQFNLFGQRWGLATFLPMVILFFSAYYFDHLGVLSLAIVNLAAWFGITVTPLQLLQQNDFSSDRIIYSGILLGILLILLAIFSLRTSIKRHFYFTYKNFGTHLLFVAVLSALFHFEQVYLIYFLLLAAVAFYHFTSALQERSFYFLVFATIYFYIGLSYVITYGVFTISTFSEYTLYLLLMYYIGSATGLVFFLIHFNRTIKNYDRL